MAAWSHTSYWDAGRIAMYRNYVQKRAPTLRGRTEDCADLSVLLLIEFAASHGLPVTFFDNNKVRYISKAERPTPQRPLHHHLSWKNQSEYYAAVKQRIGANAVLLQNTVPNPRGPEPGDLMVKSDHAAIVFAVYPPGVPHPRAGDKTIPLFPGPNVAKMQLHQTIYFRDQVDPRLGLFLFGLSLEQHFDYLNHRGEGGKKAAELILFAKVQELRADGFQFNMFAPGVLDNWKDWDGRGDPPKGR